MHKSVGTSDFVFVEPNLGNKANNVEGSSPNGKNNLAEDEKRQLDNDIDILLNGEKTELDKNTSKTLPKESDYPFKDKVNPFKKETEFLGGKEAAILEIDEMASKPETVSREMLEDRDPNNLNQHVQIVWDDIIGEPEGARSPECAWRLSNLCFQHSRNWCYTIMAVILAPPCALLMGCCFACLAFEQIWCTAPCLRCVKIYFASMRTLVMACMATFVVPVANAFGQCWRHIRVNLRKDAPDEKDFLVV